MHHALALVAGFDDLDSPVGKGGSVVQMKQRSIRQNKTLWMIGISAFGLVCVYSLFDNGETRSIRDRISVFGGSATDIEKVNFTANNPFHLKLTDSKPFLDGDGYSVEYVKDGKTYIGYILFQGGHTYLVLPTVDSGHLIVQ